jgi:hypothetical protein
MRKCNVWTNSIIVLFIKYYWDLQDERTMAWHAWDKREMHTKFWPENCKGRGPLGTSGRRWEDFMKMDGFEGVDSIYMTSFCEEGDEILFG